MQPYLLAESRGTCVHVRGTLARSCDASLSPVTRGGQSHLDTHDSANSAVRGVEGNHLGERVGEADIGVDDEDLRGVALEDRVSEVVETSRRA